LATGIHEFANNIISACDELKSQKSTIEPGVFENS
jgi:hypothetical protein